MIDNFGDVGVCWRLAVNLARRGQTVRLWIDDASALAWLAPKGAPGVQVLTWSTPFNTYGQTPGDVLVEAFGCKIATEFIASYAIYIRARGLKCIWINLEYLSAQAYAARCHRLPSPVMHGPGKGLSKHFFYPGFTPDTGGLLREPDLLAQRTSFDRAAWLRQQGVPWRGQRLVSLFCYEPAALPALLASLAADATATLLLVTAGRTSVAVQHAVTHQISLGPMWNKREKLSIKYLPTLDQPNFDRLLWACDLNFVRGEDSLVRALWAGKPCIWHIYPQHDNAHHAKLEAFLDWLQAPAALRWAHALWNALPIPAHQPEAQPGAWSQAAPFFSAALLAGWQATFTQAQHRLLQQRDLASQLLDFVVKHNAPAKP